MDRGQGIETIRPVWLDKNTVIIVSNYICNVVQRDVRKLGQVSVKRLCNTSWASKGGGCGRKLQVRLEARWMTGTPYKWEEEGRVKVLYCECLTSSFKE